MSGERDPTRNAHLTRDEGAHALSQQSHQLLLQLSCDVRLGLRACVSTWVSSRVGCLCMGVYVSA